MKPEEIFGINAGKVWKTLKSNGQLSVEQLSKNAKLKPTDVCGALGWLGRENKIQIVTGGPELLYKLSE